MAFIILMSNTLFEILRGASSLMKLFSVSLPFELYATKFSIK